MKHGLPATSFRRIGGSLLPVFAWLLGYSPPPAAAHEPIHEQIVALGQRIDANPRNAALYLRRGQLQSHHGVWEAALGATTAPAASIQPCQGWGWLEREPCSTRVDTAMQRWSSIAIDLELVRRRYDAALARLDAVAAQSPRSGPWLARRGEVLERAGRPGDARATYEQALADLASVPAGRRRTGGSAQLERQVRAALERLQRQEQAEAKP